MNRIAKATSTVTAREAAEVEAANTSGRQPVVLVHGLWLLHSSWDAWKAYVEERGYAAVAVDWPHDEAGFEAAHANAGSLAGTSVRGGAAPGTAPPPVTRPPPPRPPPPGPASSPPPHPPPRRRSPGPARAPTTSRRSSSASTGSRS